MVHITIYNSTEDFTTRLEKYIEKALSNKSITFKINKEYIFESVTDSITRFTSDPQILFMDLSVESDNAILQAKEFKLIKPNLILIFFSNTIAPLFDSLVVYPTSFFLIGDATVSLIERNILKSLNLLAGDKNKILIFKKKSSIFIFKLKKIKYIEVNKRILTIHYDRNKTYIFYATIGKMNNLLKNTNFIRCHRSYIVNIDMISNLTLHEIKLNDNTTLPIGALYYSTLKLRITSNKKPKDRIT